jgi:hypothetical protein
MEKCKDEFSACGVSPVLGGRNVLRDTSCTRGGEIRKARHADGRGGRRADRACKSAWAELKSGRGGRDETDPDDMARGEESDWPMPLRDSDQPFLVSSDVAGPRGAWLTRQRALTQFINPN